MKLLFLVSSLIIILPKVADSYPHFIGYKYASCVTCHYNTHGNGPINDYGRALWAAEIAGRAWAGKKSADELGMSSGFLGSKELPWWIRPGLKARQLWVQSNPGSPSQLERNITMQAEANVALFFDQEQKYAIIASMGYVPEPMRLQNSTQDIDTWISREHYFRMQATEELWLSVGMMDKVYGIRHANHTAFSRAAVGVAQNDQAHGLVAHYIKSAWELTLNLFAGNLFQDADLQQAGGSMMFEYDVKDLFRVGASFLHSSNDYVGNQRMGVHAKYGFGYGAALLFETGVIRNSPKAGTATQGYYVYSEAIQKIVRGYHLFVSGQSYKADMIGSNPDILKFGTGFLIFPRNRFEFRIEAENTRVIQASPQVSPDSWALLGQLHLSL